MCKTVHGQLSDVFCDVMTLTTTSNDIVMTTFDTNMTFRVMLLTSSVRILDRGFLHNPILRSRIRLSDGLITTMMSSIMALLLGGTLSRHSFSQVVDNPFLGVHIYQKLVN